MKRGITFLNVMVAVVIMAIFSSTATIVGINVLNDSKKDKFATEIAFIQEAVNNYHSKNDEYPILEAVTVNLKNVNTNDMVQFINETQAADSTIILYELDFSKLGTIDTIYGHSEEIQDIYAVSKESGIVYYLKGININDVTYFTLTDDLKNLIDYVDTNENTVTKDGISFIPSTLEWTANNISTRVVVPSKYTSDNKEVNVNVLYKNQDGTSGTKNLQITSETNNECTIDNISGNYTIKVSYENNTLSQTYVVTNFDNVAPKFEVSDRIDLVSRSDNSSYSYIELKNVSDDLSGIKHIKYERENIFDSNPNDGIDDIAVYFKSNGIDLYNEIIEIKEDTKYITVYVEDNAGNYTCFTKKV